MGGGEVLDVGGQVAEANRVGLVLGTDLFVAPAHRQNAHIIALRPGALLREMGEIAERFAEGQGGERVQDLALRERPPQAVGAQQEEIVAREAGLSQGIINLHFKTKERLLTETLRYLADEYRNACHEAAARTEGSPEAGLRAMVELDFQRGICERNKLAVWFAFWGERKFRPTYRRICSERDRSYDDMVRVQCARLCEHGGYPEVDPALVADGLSALTDGLWLDLLVRPESMTRDLARRISLTYLADAFPRHFQRPAATGRR